MSMRLTRKKSAVQTVYSVYVYLNTESTYYKGFSSY